MRYAPPDSGDQTFLILSSMALTIASQVAFGLEALPLIISA